MQNSLTTQRLILLRLPPADAVLMAQALNNLEISRWTTVIPHPYSVRDANEFINLCQAAESSVFTITENEHSIGFISADAQLGYWLAQPHRRQGIMLEAANAVVQDHFATTSTNELKSSYFIGNSGSQAVLRKLRFVNSTKAVANCVAIGIPVDVQNMTLSREQWGAQG